MWLGPSIKETDSPTTDTAWAARLSRARTHVEACECIVTVLASMPGLKPSVYLERGGRLRCQAAATYRHVFDGMPPSAGVIGRTFSTGEPAVIQDVGRCEDYLAITDGVVAELAHPVRSHGAVVGVLSVESGRALEEDVVTAVAAAAEALGARLQALGGSLSTTPAQALLHHALRLTNERHRGRLHHELLTAAMEVSGLDSAALFELAPDGTADVLVALGPLAEALEADAHGDLARIAGLVASGASCVTVGGEPGQGLSILTGLQTSGLRAAAVLRKREHPLRALIVAGTEPDHVSTEAVELLELLCLLACSVGRSCDLLAHLERQAATDPLTGLGHHGAFYDRLTGAPAESFAAVVMLDLDQFKAVNDRLGHAAGDGVLRAVASQLQAGLRASDELFRVGGDEFAVLMPATEAADVEHMTTRLVDTIGAATATTASVGVAMTVASEPLLAAARRADRALYGAKAAGRDRVVLAPAPD